MSAKQHDISPECVPACWIYVCASSLWSPRTIKLGHTVRAKYRISYDLKAMPLFITPGDEDDENAIRQRFSHLHIANEFLRGDDEFIEYFQMLALDRNLGGRIGYSAPLSELDQWRNGNLRETRSWNLTGKPIRRSPRPRATRTCARCGCRFTAKASRVDKGEGIYCSKACQNVEGDLEQRLLAAVRITPAGCWEWTKAKSSSGYGHIKVNGRAVPAHRVAASLWRDFDIMSDLQILHQCDNRPCINPDHLFVGTNADNVLDRHRKGRSSGGRMTGESNPGAKLSKADVREIRLLRSQGRTATSIGLDFGVSTSLVSMIDRRLIWREVV